MGRGNNISFFNNFNEKNIVFPVFVYGVKQWVFFSKRIEKQFLRLNIIFWTVSFNLFILLIGLYIYVVHILLNTTNVTRQVYSIFFLILSFHVVSSCKAWVVNMRTHLLVLLYLQHEYISLSLSPSRFLSLPLIDLIMQ
jgi:hypothetical protein